MPLRIHLLCFTIAASTIINGCSPGPRTLEEIKTSGTLVVATRNAPTSFYLNSRNEPAGPEYDLVQAFAASLGVEVEYRIEDTASNVLETLIDGDADLAAAGLIVTQERRESLLFGPPYQEVTQQVVCHRMGKRPETVTELADAELAVTEGSSYVERLEALQLEYPGLKWWTTGANPEHVLEWVWDRRIDCTLANSNIVKINRRYFPELVVAFDLSKPQQTAWAMPETATGLQAAVKNWFDTDAGRAQVTAVQDYYYGYVGIFDYVDTRVYVRRIGTRYQNYREWFERASEEYDLAVELLAAMAYQESHWDPGAVSATGVRGIMMLTERAAEDVDVEDRLDPEQSIDGGARYLAMLKENLSDEIEEPDRTWLALAAYNIGHAHLRDAQRLARRLGKDPLSWSDMKGVLPLLSDKRCYKNLEYGYARGLGAVRYVQRVRHYMDILERRARL